MKSTDIFRMGRRSFIFMALFFILLIRSNAKGFEFPDISSTSIHAEATKTGEIFTYAYAVSNPSTSIGGVSSIDINVKKPPEGVELSGDSLISGNCLLGESTELSLRAMREAGTPAIPVGMDAPLNWSCSYDADVMAGWGSSEFPPSDILPGQSLGGFQITSRGLPGIRAYRASSFVDIDDLPIEPPEDDGPDEDRYFRELAVIHKAIKHAEGKTLGPTAPPAVFDSLVFLDTLRGYVAESRTLGWLTDAALVATLTDHLDAAAVAIAAGDTATAKSQLQAFIAALPVPPAGTAACSSECSGLLVFNAQYLLGQLPSLPDLVVTTLSASTDQVNAGGTFTTTATVRNRGGGVADPSTLRFLLSSDATIDPTDTPLADLPLSTLETNQTQTLTPSLTLPATLPPGNYTLGACADVAGVITESSETNNCMAGGMLTVKVPGPPNDEIADATQITTFPFSETIMTTTATTAPDEPIQTCGNLPNSNSVWYRLTAPANGRITADTFGSSYNTVLSAWTGDLSRALICNNNARELQSEIGFLVSAGQTIFLEVTDYDPFSGGGTLVLNVRFLPPPSNDDVTSATEITTFPFSETIETGAATTALTARSEPTQRCGFPPNSNSVWYRLTALAPMVLTINTFGSDYETVLSVWTSDLSMELTCSWPARVLQSNVFVSAGQTIFLEVTDYNAYLGGGTLVLNVGLVPPVRPNASPVSALPPIVTCPIEGDCVFHVPAADRDGDPIRFRLSAPNEIGMAQPGPPHAPHPARIDAASGLYRWDTRGATLTSDPVSAPNTLYSTQVMIEEIAGDGNLKSRVPIDFFIRLIKEAGSVPRFDPSSAPSCNSTLLATPGVPFTLSVQASDPDPEQQVDLNAIGLPIDAITMPSLPARGNPVSSIFTWTPTASQEGVMVMNFIATDTTGLQALCPITLQVATTHLLLTPPTATSAVGTSHTVTATLLATGHPVPNSPVAFQILTGPHAGRAGSATTNADGQATFTYTGTAAGTDQIRASATGDFNGDGVSETISALRVIKMWEPLPTFALTLAVDESGRVESQPYGIACPDTCVASYPEGTEVTLTATGIDGFAFSGWGGACTGTGSCQVRMLSDQAVTATFRRLIDCTLARPSLSQLGPPNHQLMGIDILGITDPDGGPVQVTITAITQDEPVNGLGDGDISPDGFGIGTAQAQLRTERSGLGNGRVYLIAVNAEDGKGGRCTGTVTVSVPRDQGKGAVPIDDGQQYDSTRP